MNESGAEIDPFAITYGDDKPKVKEEDKKDQEKTEGVKPPGY